MEKINNVFNRTDKIIEGWYWVLRSHDLKNKKATAVNLMGKELVVYRTENGKVVILDAYCAHMGAHLAQGTIEKDSIRCMFHYWKYNSHGFCEEIPSLNGQCNLKVQVKAWPVEERYGLIWIWTGEKPLYPLPCPPELDGKETRFLLCKPFYKKCHPHIVLINAIDEHHFNSVHQLPVKLRMEPKKIHENCIQFSNTTGFQRSSIWGKLFGPFYKNALTYSMMYWNGSTSTVTAGPDFLHVYIFFALRPTSEGQTEGHMVLLTRKRSGIFGYITDQILLKITRFVGNYFAKGDTEIFSNIRFNLKTPIKSDWVIMKFIEHIENQKTINWSDKARKDPIKDNNETAKIKEIYETIKQ